MAVEPATDAAGGRSVPELWRRGRTPIVAASLALGLAMLVPGVIVNGQARAGWFVPVCDSTAAVLFVLTAVLAVVDVSLRRDGRSLPVLVIATASTTVWIAHLIVFPQVMTPSVSRTVNEMTSWLFVLANLTTPFMLGAALLRHEGEVPVPGRAIQGAVATGLAAGLAVIIASLVLGASSLLAVTREGFFSPLTTAVGFAGLVPAAAALAMFVRGRRGDERTAPGLLAALILCGFTSLALLLLHQRFSALWYSVHILAVTPAAALLSGQLLIYALSVRAEQEAQRAVAHTIELRRLTYEATLDMATQVDLSHVVDGLLRRAIRIVPSDRATLARIGDDGIGTVEATIDVAGGATAPVGYRIPITALVAGGERIARQLLTSHEAIAFGAYAIDDLPPEHQAVLKDIRHSLAIPLQVAGQTVAALLVARRSDQAFTDDDIAALHQLVAPAGLLIRNARLLEEARAASRMKSEFLNLAGHELRTPVTVINGYAEMLKDGSLGELPAAARRAVSALVDRTDEMQRLVEQLITAARLQGGDLYVAARAITDLNTVVSAAVAQVTTAAPARGATVEVELADEPVMVRASPADVRRIVDNLIANALIYSADAPWVRVSVARNGGGQVVVEDHGKGIPRTDRERIFDEFTRIDDPEFGYPLGIGMGLSISRRLAELHEGTLELAGSEVGQGSRFVLHLPLDGD